MKLMKISKGLFLVPILVSSVVSANEAEKSPRLMISAGAGSGALIAGERSVPFRINAGLEYVLKAAPRLSIGYQFGLPVASDVVMAGGQGQSVHRMVHYFPRVRYLLTEADYADGGLSVAVAPGVAIQHLGSMMGGGSAGVGPLSSIAVQAALEYSFALEDRLHLGLGAAGEYLAPVRGAVPLPRTLIWSGSIGLRYLLGGASSP